MTTQEKVTKAKLNLLELGSYLGNVSEACRTLGYSAITAGHPQLVGLLT